MMFEKKPTREVLGIATEDGRPIENGEHVVTLAVALGSDDAPMWRQRAEAAEAEVHALRTTIPPNEVAEAAEVCAMATRLVALADVYPKRSVARAICIMRDHEAKASDEDAAALRSIIHMIERRMDPEAWHAQLARDNEATG